jgi:ABC-type phosphate/phosphonate transport system substrate-binding protein
VLLVSVGFLPRGQASDPAANKPAQLKLGMLESMFRDINPGMVQAMSRPFRSLFERQTGYSGDVELVADANTLATKLQNQELNLGVFHGFEYAQIRQRHPNLKPLCVSMPQSRTCQACVIVHKECKAECLKDLHDHHIVIPRGIKAHCLAFAEKARSGLPNSVAKLLPKPTQTTEELLNEIATNCNGAALVDVGSYNGYLNLQPGAAKHLRVLCQSEVFPVSVITYRENSVDEEVIAKIKAGLIGANRTAQGKPLMMLWNLKGFEDVPADYEAQLDAILKAYPENEASK